MLLSEPLLMGQEYVDRPEKSFRISERFRNFLGRSGSSWSQQAARKRQSEYQGLQLVFNSNQLLLEGATPRLGARRPARLKLILVPSEPIERVSLRTCDLSALMM